MSRGICVVQDFLTDAHRAKMQETAERLGFRLWLFHSGETEAAKARLPECEILYTQSKEMVRAIPSNFRWLALSSAGADGFLPDLAQSGSPDCLMTISNVYGVTISEHILMVTLMLLRRMPDYQADMRNRRWSVPLPIRSIRDGAFTILGTGDIGRSAAERFRALGAAKVIGVSRSGRSVDAFDEVYPIARLDEVLPRAEFLIMALPGTPETRGLMSRTRLALLPKGAYLVNVGRGAALDQTALREALERGDLAGAALDVMTPEPLPEDAPLWNAPNLVLTPHVSGNMTLGYTCDATVDLFCANLARYAEGQPLRGTVDRSRGY